MEWIIAARKEVFDVDHAFDEGAEIPENRITNLKVGDLVYIYVTAPEARIKYKTICIKGDETSPLKLRFIAKLVDDRLTLKYLKDNHMVKANIQGHPGSAGNPDLFEHINYVSEQKENPEVVSTTTSADGKQVHYYTTRYERNPGNRQAAITIHGCKCMICGFDFEKTYGALGKDFIEVHHVKPLCSLDEAVAPNPDTDLICVCSNCHRMLHRKRNEVLTPGQLKRLLKKENQKNQAR